MVQNTVDHTSPETTSEKSERVSPAVKKIWWIVTPKLLNLVNVTALLTVAGFFVIQSYLASFSMLFTFRISVTQYVAAGINLVLAIVWYIILPSLGYGVILAAGIGVLYLVGHFCITRSKPIHNLWDRFRNWWLPMYHRLYPYLRILWSLYQLVAWALFILVVISLGLVYGTAYYVQSPRMLGGGMPADVILVFREEQPTQTSIWGFPINSSNTRQSEQVQLLIELTDGVIVRYAATNTTTMVKNDVLQGIIDADTVSGSPAQPLGTPTP
jgi:hypothetical protein